MTKVGLALALVLASLGLAGCTTREASGGRARGHASAQPPRQGPHADHRAPASPTADHQGHDEHADHQGTPPVAQGEGQADSRHPASYAPLTIDEATARTIGLSSVEATEQEVARTIRTQGVITVDETRSAHIHAKVRGYVEELHVAFVGQKVRRGQPLCSIFSPEVYSAELEYVSLLAEPRLSGLDGDLLADDQKARAQVLEAARRRLLLWDVTAAEIDRIEKTRQARRAFSLTSPREGVVVDKRALAGMYVEPSVELYLVSDLARVWAIVDLYEADVPLVKIGDVARLTVEGITGEPLSAPIAFLPPTMDEATRTLKARIDIDNRQGKLRPGSFISAELTLSAGRSVTIPEGAVLRTGKRSVVFVVEGGEVHPREIELGGLFDGRYAVRSGLRAGERVATGAQFLLDSESRLRATSSSPGGGHVH